ncbi:hypothetical protein TNCT_40321 [Trichonephila clavata]|uniref:Uncharacterized protein n=1 Tax=Trichonephila clavata TaxID=2740835 RepID=A0A8X6G3P0_TRICU|nr:hypothetical protein TNCT_40321 [Trichonephila clavata]
MIQLQMDFVIGALGLLPEQSSHKAVRAALAEKRDATGKNEISGPELGRISLSLHPLPGSYELRVSRLESRMEKYSPPV